MIARTSAIADLEGRLGYVFHDKGLIDQALTHASIGDGARRTKNGRLEDNERLEFLGDRVLGLLTAELLLAAGPELREGDLAQRLNALVNGTACAEAARRMGIGEALRLSGGETRTGGREKPSILADACEAVMAAVYLDGGLTAAREVYMRFWGAEAGKLEASRAKDPKTRLQEEAQARAKALPAYAVVGRSGPDHAPIFTVEVRVEGFGSAQGAGPSRQAAEKAAAEALLEREFTT